MNIIAIKQAISALESAENYISDVQSDMGLSDNGILTEINDAITKANEFISVPNKMLEQSKPSSVISFPIEALLNKDVAEKAMELNISLATEPNIVSASDLRHEELGVFLTLLENNQVPYDQTTLGANPGMDTTSVRFFNGERSSRYVTSKDVAIAEFIQDLLSDLATFDDIDELRMYLQTRAFFMSKPLLVQGMTSPPIEQ